MFSNPHNVSSHETLQIAVSIPSCSVAYLSNMSHCHPILHSLIWSTWHFFKHINYKVVCYAALSSLLPHLNILIQHPILKYPQPMKYLIVYFQSVHLFHLYQTVTLLKALIFIAQIKMHKEILLIKKELHIISWYNFITFISLFSFVWQIKYHTHKK